MKAIISHDIDHFTLHEHLFKDLILTKFFVRSKIEFLTGQISFKELILRNADLFTDKWQNINEVIEFNKGYKVPSTFFIAVQKGLGLSYNNKQAKEWIDKITQKGCSVGLHLIEYSDISKIKEEKTLFTDLSGISDFGTRIHYIRNNENTFTNLDEAGLYFDSSEFGFKNPYKIGKMWQFPFQIMDGFIIQKPKRRQSKNLQQAKEETLRVLDKCAKNNLTYIGVDFHDRYFSNRFVTWKEWYMWLIDHLASQKIEFVDFKTAIKELERVKV